MTNRRMVLYSGQRANNLSPVSVLAVVETLLASVVGLLLVVSGEYQILSTSLFLTFLVHLRSEKSVEDGVRVFGKLWAKLKISAPSRRSSLKYIMATLATSSVWIFLLAPALLDDFGWVGSYGSFVLVGFVSLNILIAAAVFGAVLSFFLSSEVRESNLLDGEQSGELSNRTLIITAIFGTVLLPGAVAAVTVYFIVIRSTSTLRYLREGLANFPRNWATLMLRTDLTTEPELLPGLPHDHVFSFNYFKEEFANTKQGFLMKYSNLLPLGMFVPSIFYRLVLKSSFWFYAPLIWVASPPRGLARELDGKFRWDPSLARTPVDTVAALVALAGASFFFFRVWDNGAYQAASAWAKENDFPAYWPLLAAGINPDGLDMWYLLPSVGALLSLAVFVWAMQISARAKLTGRFPSQFSLWCIYKLNSAKNIASVLTVALGIVVLLIYYSAFCQLPTSMQNVVSMFSGGDCALP